MKDNKTIFKKMRKNTRKKCSDQIFFSHSDKSSWYSNLLTFVFCHWCSELFSFCNLATLFQNNLLKQHLFDFDFELLFEILDLVRCQHWSLRIKKALLSILTNPFFCKKSVPYSRHYNPLLIWSRSWL